MRKILVSLTLVFFLISCGGKKEDQAIKPPTTNEEAIQTYQEALDGLKRGDYLYASKKFSEAEGMLPQIDWASKSALMSSYCLYNINFYDEAVLNLKRFIKIYPASPYVSYAYYLIAISYYEQILDEDKDIQPLIISKRKIESYIKKFPDTDYTIDLKFKLDLVINQLAAKELSIARYYIKNEKWIPAINRLKIIVEDYDKTIFVEEALHRLVEIYYKIGLEEEAKVAAVLLGYNYNSSEWYKKSYKILNKNYEPINIKKDSEDDSLIKRTIKKILFIDEKSGKN
jgi:outer membrane protein assembly factor BamD|tara:strand:+ start:6900 stop:7754 length:855 start_codon:yes stop_codon:yes gene_type:complete